MAKPVIVSGISKQRVAAIDFHPSFHGSFSIKGEMLLLNQASREIKRPVLAVQGSV